MSNSLRIRSLRLALLLALFVLLGAPLALAQQPFEAAFQGSGPDTGLANDVATDDAGNSYVVGTFRETITFGSITLTSADDGSFSDPSDVFVVKYDADGTALWARRGGTAEFNDFGEAVAVDADGNVLVTAMVAGVAAPATFDGGDNDDTDLGPSNGFDAALVKYDADGNLLWANKNDSAQQAGSDTQDSGEAVAVAPDGSVYFVGGFEGTIGFGEETLTSAGSADAFIVKYDADGSVLWARSGGSSGQFSSDEARGVGVGPEGNVYAMGEFSNVATFESESVQSNGNDDLFVIKYDADGNVVWLSSIGGADTEYDFGLGIDGEGSTYLAGGTGGTLLIGDDVIESSGLADVFVAKFDSSGNAVWGRGGGGDGTDFGGGISADEAGNVYYTGFVEGPNVAFGDTSVELTGEGNEVFLVSYEADGTLRRVVTAGGPGGDEGGGTAVSPDGSIVYTAGLFTETATFGDETLTSAGGSDVFVVRSAAAALPVELARFDVAAEGTEAVLSWQTLSETNNAGFHVEHRRAHDAGAWRTAAFVEGAGTTAEPQRYRHRVEGLAPGRHVFRLRQEDRDGGATYSAPVEATLGLADGYALSAPAPNPARQRARFGLTVDRAQSVRVALYDALGQRVRVLHDGPVAPGEHRFTVEAGALASGLYLIRVTGDGFSATRTLTLVR